MGISEVVESVGGGRIKFMNSKQKGFVHAIFALVVVGIMIAGGMVYWWQKSATTNEGQNTQTSPITQSQNIPQVASTTVEQNIVSAPSVYIAQPQPTVKTNTVQTNTKTFYNLIYYNLEGDTDFQTYKSSITKLILGDANPDSQQPLTFSVDKNTVWKRDGQKIDILQGGGDFPNTAFDIVAQNSNNNWYAKEVILKKITFTSEWSGGFVFQKTGAAGQINGYNLSTNKFTLSNGISDKNPIPSRAYNTGKKTFVLFDEKTRFILNNKESTSQGIIDTIGGVKPGSGGIGEFIEFSGSIRVNGYIGGDVIRATEVSITL